MAQKILVIGAGANDALLLATLKEKHGEDIILVTPEEAKEQGLKMEDFGNIPTFKITAPPTIPIVEFGEYKSGKEERRERRKKERNSNKRRW